jgi:hypothetical protein
MSLGIYYNTHGVFTPKKVDCILADNATPLGFALGGIDKDGDIDIFISNYIRKKQMESQNNFTKDYGPISQLLLNNGDNTFTEIPPFNNLFSISALPIYNQSNKLQ